MKYTLRILIIVLLTAAGTELCSQTNASDCIKHVIEADSTLSGERNHASETISLSAAIDQYVEALQALNFEGCPNAFTMAFEAHIEAWSAMTEVTDHYPDLRGELHDIFDEIKKSQHAAPFKALLKEIWDTWDDVENAMK